MKLRESLLCLLLLVALSLPGCVHFNMVNNAQAGFVADLQDQIEAGEDVNQVHEGFTPLMGAAVENRLDSAKLLLDAGADVDKVAVDKHGELTALYVAAKSGHPEMVKLLIERGANVNLKVDGDLSPLTAAIVYAQGPTGVDVCKILIAAGADVNERVGKLQLNPLLLAAKVGRPALAELLITAGTKLDATDTNGSSALDHARRQGDPAMIALLEKHGVKSGKSN